MSSSDADGRYENLFSRKMQIRLRRERLICFDSAEFGQVSSECQVTVLLILFFFGQPQRMLALSIFILPNGEGLRLVLSCPHHST